MAFKTYKGKFKPKNPERYTGKVKEIVYRSQWEKYVMMYCDTASNVIAWSSEEVVVPYLCETDKRYHRYFVDFLIKTNEGVLLVEVKPAHQCKTPRGPKTKKLLNEALTYIKNQSKWKAAESYALDRGWKFVIWTETELQNMGIMPKPLKKVPGTMKKLPRLKRPKKSR